MVRYYSYHRPVSIGTFPKPAGNKVLEIHNFDDAEYVPAIGRTAFGYLEYEKPLDPKLAADYELLPGDEGKD